MAAPSLSAGKLLVAEMLATNSHASPVVLRPTIITRPTPKRKLTRLMIAVASSTPSPPIIHSAPMVPAESCKSRAANKMTMAKNMCFKNCHIAKPHASERNMGLCQIMCKPSFASAHTLAHVAGLAIFGASDSCGGIARSIQAETKNEIASSKIAIGAVSH